MPRAAGLAATLEEAFGVNPRLIEGEKGVFDVKLDGELVFSKHAEGRFPDADEIVRTIRSRVGSVL